MDKNKLPVKVKAGYGMGMLGECLAMNTFYIYFIFFLTDAVGLNPGIAGTIALVAVFWGAFTDLFAGIKTDNSRNPKGRRRPFAFKAAIPLGIAIFLMYTDFAIFPFDFKPVYFLVVTMLFWLALAFTNIPYLSLGSEITDDYGERSSVRSYANVLNYAGMIVASSGTVVLVSAFSGDGGLSDTSAWSKVGLLFGVIVIIAYWISVAATKGRDSLPLAAIQEEIAKKTSFFKAFLEVVKIKPFRHILLYTVFAYGGVILFTSTYIFYLFYNLHFDDAQVALIMLVYCFMVMGVSAILGVVKIEKKIIVVCLTTVLGIGLIIGHFTGLNTAGMYLMFFLFALGISAYFVQIYSMVYDVCDVDEFVNGGGRDGSIVSIFYFVGKVIGGIAMAAVGLILTLVQYDPTLPMQTAYTQAGISMSTLLIPGILMIIGSLIMAKYPLNAKNFAALREAIDLRNEGKEYSVEEFKNLV